jgi:hypothetical protein
MKENSSFVITGDQVPAIDNSQINQLVAESKLNAEKFNSKFAELQQSPVSYKQLLNYFNLKGGETAVITNGRVSVVLVTNHIHISYCFL